jgi:cell division transport system permease protein
VSVKKGTNLSRVYAIITTSLVLFMVGISFLIFLHGNKLINQFKESVEFSIILKDSVENERVNSLKVSIARAPYTQFVEFVSKEEAMNRYIALTGDDFREMLDNNPLYASINIKLKAAYANPDSIQKIQSHLLQEAGVAEFYYEKKLVDSINDNVNKMALIVVFISVILLIITFVMIDGTVRLAMYSNRFLIRSMKLVGATKWFIIKPYLWRSLLDGLISGLLAVGGLVMLLNVLLNIIPELTVLQDVSLTVILFALVVSFGMVFSGVSTYFAVGKYLNMKLDELY